MRTRRTCWLVVMLAACAKDAPPPPPETPPPTVTDARVAKDFVALLAASNKPALVGPFAPLKLSPTLTIREASRVVPDLVRTPMKQLDWFEHTSDEYPGLRFRVERVGQLDSDPHAWVVGRLRVVFPDHAIRARLVAAWGEPREHGKVAYWLDPAAKLRCGLQVADGRDAPKQTMLLDCQGYLPLADLIGTGPRFGFEGDRPLLGATEHDVRARWRVRVFDDSRIVLWPTEVQSFPTSVQLTDPFDVSTKVTGWSITLDQQHETARGLLEAKLGKPREIDGVLVFSAKPRIALDGGELQVGKRPE